MANIFYALILFSPYVLGPWILVEGLVRLLAGRWMGWGWRLCVLALSVLAMPFTAIAYLIAIDAKW